MATYYLIRGNQIIADIDSSAGDVTALPLVRDSGEAPLSLLNQEHAQALMDNLVLTAHEALDALGLADLRSTMLRTVFVGPSSVSVPTGDVVAYHLIDVGDYAIWQINCQQDDLLALHSYAWTLEPVQVLGGLAVVQTFGSTFYADAVRTAAGLTAQQALARRNRIADYLEALGYSATTALRAATDEHAQMVGIAEALGYTAEQLWSVMVE